MARSRIPRISDGDIYRVLKTWTEGRAPLKLTVTTFSTAFGPFMFPGKAVNGVWELLHQADGSAIEQFNAHLDGVTLQYWRGGANDPKSAYLDEVEISISDNAEGKVRSAASLLSLLRPVSPPSGLEAAEAVNEMRAMQESTYGRLERLHEEVTRDSLQHRRALDNDFGAKVTQLEEKYAKRQAELDASAESARAELATREEALKERERALDDRDNTHARRDIRERMLKDIKDRIDAFGVSQSTEHKRSPVALGMLALGTVLTGMLGYTVLELLRLDALLSPASTQQALDAAVGAARWWLWGRLAVLSFGLLGTILYYIRWQQSWAHQHAQSEFNLQQFYLDVNRANWIIESCLEWRKDTDSSPIPTVLLESITRGLFSTADDGAKEQVVHPADQLASALLGTASKLKLKAGDAEMEFDKPSKIPKDG